MQDQKKWRPFEEAREYARALELKGQKEWKVYCKTGQKPDDIPACPNLAYKQEWEGYGDWLGTGNIHKKTFRPFEEAREYVRALGLKDQAGWEAYRKSGRKPDDIPTNPRRVYKDKWISVGDWLGTGAVANQSKMYQPFPEAREYIRTLKLKGQTEWAEYCKLGQRPDDIPAAPEAVYKDTWISWGDWLGTGTVATKERVYKPFLEAREYIRALKLEGQRGWRAYCRSGQKPDDIPADPGAVYKGEFRGYGDWLGAIMIWRKTALLALLEDLRLHLDTLSQSEIYMLLQQSGALPNLCLATGKKSAQSVLEDLKNNDGQGLEAAIKGIAEEELETRQQEVDDSDYGEINNQNPSDIQEVFGDLSKLATPEGLRAVDMASPIYGLNEEIAEYLISNRVNALWESYINGEEEAVNKALKGKGGHYFNEIRRRFLAEKASVESLPIPTGWSFKDDYGKPCQPLLMQRWTAWQILNKQRAGNWSGVGSGKTLSAILTSRVTDARVTLIIANSATINVGETINGWKKQILNAYPDSIVHTHEEVREDLILAPDRYHYILLNYEKFQREGENRSSLIEILLRFEPDFIVLDEIHFVKQRNERASKRREALEYLIRTATENNPLLYVLGMSATPVINNLQEAKKLLEIVMGQTFPDVGVIHTINNTLTLHRLLMLHGLRYRPCYEQEMPPIKVSEVRNGLLGSLRKAQGSILATEQTLLSAKLEITKAYFKKGTLVYTHYIEGMIDPICQYLLSMGFKVGLYTGADKSGLYPFLNGEIDILLGSSSVGTGLDGLQKICNRLVILSLPWTSAGYEQLIGRLLRQGQDKQVEVIIPQIVLEREGETWSWDELRLACIEYKHTLSECVLDGKIPDTISIDQQEFLKQSRQLLEQWIDLSFGRLVLSA